MPVANQFHLHGGALTVSYFPLGEGPVIAGKGRTTLVYQDAQGTRTYGSQELKVESTAIGTLVTATLHIIPDLGTTTFTLLVPAVSLGPSTSVPIRTEGITTLHRSFLIGPFGPAQRETYSLTALSGTASSGILPG
jgi:hypothetical protein